MKGHSECPQLLAQAGWGLLHFQLPGLIGLPDHLSRQPLTISLAVVDVICITSLVRLLIVQRVWRILLCANEVNSVSRCEAFSMEGARNESSDALPVTFGFG